MSKYVKLEDAINEMTRLSKEQKERTGYGTAPIEDIVDILANLPITEIVRCKDCMHKYVTGDTTQYYVCDFMDAQFDENGYCHHGEKEEVDTPTNTPTNAPTDFISRQAAIEAMEVVSDGICQGQAVEAIESLPPVEPKRPKGEWISNHDGTWNCSECGLRVLVIAKGNFCPNCGADMRGEK